MSESPHPTERAETHSESGVLTGDGAALPRYEAPALHEQSFQFAELQEAVHPPIAPVWRLAHLEPSPSSRVVGRWLLVMLAVGLMAAVLHAMAEQSAAWLMGYFGVFVQITPFALLGFLAYIGVQRTWGVVLAYLWHASMVLSMAATPALMVFLTFLPPPSAVSPALSPNWPVLAGAAAWGFLGVVAAGLVLMPAVRRLLAGVLPFDPRSHVHAIALSLVLGGVVMFFGQLIATGGNPVLLELIKRGESAFVTGPQELFSSMVYMVLWTVPASMVAVGFLVTRTWREALERLGLVRPTGRQVALGIGVAVGLAGVLLLTEPLFFQLWERMGLPRTDQETFEKILAPAISPLGAVILGLSAGISEEVAVRGVLQPRLGILLPNLFFTSLHAFQYGFDGLLIVFLIGTVLGLVRRATNTTTACIVHALYDFILVFASYLTGQTP
ncbi:MAG: CPBP family intramembrane glutamic endopeptidase [Armatimonadota bacterium]